MLEGMYTAAAGMAAQQQRLDSLSNDVANVNTTGYKSVRVAFRDLVYTPEWLATQTGVDEGAGAAATEVGRSRQQGSLQRTDAPLDVALTGQGFLQVKRADGTLALTRDGNLKFDAQGRLSTQRGELVQPQIKLPAGKTEDDIKIAQDGTVRVGGTALGRMALVDVRSPDGLKEIGDNLFVTTAASGAATAAAPSTTVQQGALEMSDVDMGDTMSQMMEAQRAYEMASKAIQAQDKAAEIANGIKR